MSDYAAHKLDWSKSITQQQFVRFDIKKLNYLIMSSLNQCRVCLAERSDLESMFKHDKHTVMDIYLVTGVKVSFWVIWYWLINVIDDISIDCWDKEQGRSLYL